ncbi:MAG: tetratricopeptide repeat protein [bacterium]
MTNKQFSFSLIPKWGYFLYLCFFSGLVFLFYLALQPFIAERYYKDAFHFSVYKRYKYAIEDMRTAISYAPWESYYMVLLGRFYQDYYAQMTTDDQRLKLLADAEAIYIKTLHYDKYNPWVYLYLVHIYSLYQSLLPYKADFYAQKIDAAYKKIAVIGFNNPLFQLNYGYYLHRQGRYSEAVPVYERVISYDDRMGDAYLNLADIYIKQKNYDQAVSYLQRLLAINPSYRNARVTLGNLYIFLKEYDKAYVLFKEEQLVNPDQELILRTLISLSVNRQDWASAILYLERFYVVAPKEAAKFFHVYIQSLIESKAYQKAYRLLLNYVVQFPNDVAADALLRDVKTKL